MSKDKDYIPNSLIFSSIRYLCVLTLEEVFYLCYSLKCLKINGDVDTGPLNEEELWRNFKSKKDALP
ncbi:tRNA intron endonuclease, amino-terminal domain protein [Medicago truncatula]|uniref:tRNA intron endonuclease, amino-terminal domain protein n=1 Tax=Medicago truncatula TaxID=3880 RepID=G7JK92_MEDTR|nr:tRNA intron endonuclease, amino-terminal domain protein [Medicago truncatula]